MLEGANVKYITVEAQLGDRPFMVTEADNPRHVQIKTVEELWHKENMINIGGRRAIDIDPLAREIMWQDADCFPMCTPRDWYEEVWHKLQHNEFVQCWEYLINFGPQNQPVTGPQMSFMKTYAAAGYQIPEGKSVKNTLNIWNPSADGYDSTTVGLGRTGLAWAANVRALNKVGWLVDKCILGSGDWHMAHGLVGAMTKWDGEFRKLSAYQEYLLDWEDKALRWIKKDVDYVPITVGHWWHGNKQQRKYGERGAILISNGYSPYKDVKYDGQGLLQLDTWDERQIRLRDQIRTYFAGRNEDSIDLL